MLTFIIFLLILSVLIIVHEFGHFIVAKLSNVKVEEFGLGFPPKLLSIRRGETLYTLNAFPFGGFVRLFGEEGPRLAGLKRPGPETSRMFVAKSKKIRAAIIVAGVVMNLLLAFFSFTILYSVIGVPRKIHTVKVLEVLPGSPIEQTGIEKDIRILSVDSVPVPSIEEFIKIIGNKKGQEVTLEIQNKRGEQSAVKVTPRANPPQGEGPLGVVITDVEQYFPPMWQRPFWGAVYGFQEGLVWGGQTLIGLKTIVASIFAERKLPADIAGPVGIYQITGSVAQQGWLAVLRFVGVLSVNLAILNIVPFPALDGGRLLFVGIEAVFRGRARKIIPKVERVANIAGFALLMALIIAITFQDIRRLIGG